MMPRRPVEVEVEVVGRRVRRVVQSWAMRYGVVILPDQRWSTGAERWRRAEELGLDHAWTYDHLAWRSLRDGAWMGAVPTLAAASLVTRTIRLGLLVSSPNFRHPVPFAKELMTLDDLCGGRLTAGIGAGGTGWDATVLGGEPWSPAERAGRFAEFVELADALLRAPAGASYRGRYYAADDARNLPGCVQQPRVPFAIAASGPRGMRVAAGYGQSWVTIGDPAKRSGGAAGIDVVRKQMARVDDACAALGRDPASLERLVLTGPNLDQGLDSPEAFRDLSGRYGEIGVTDLVVHWPRPDDPYAGELARFEAAMAAR
jgi:alkanesulfonate monooxygenase SsuD/methylene tetrahydromethanopterin reductase-like flavin-dependent oxidoreductase (luciferase family)